MLRFDNRELRPARRERQTGGHERGLGEVCRPYLYNPGPEVTVDEQLVLFRGRCPFWQFMSSKPAEYGFMIWVDYDAQSSFAWKMQIYTGNATRGSPEKNQGMQVMLDVTDGLTGYSVTCDSFFTSYELSQQLLKRRITMEQDCGPPEHTAQTAEVSGHEDRKLAIILDYNHNKGGVDNLDKVFGTSSCKRMTTRWLLVIIHNIIDVSSSTIPGCLIS
ncbi:piggyBac transposable element-derived protein 4-like isoform X2 [Thunnus maccoyii]|nr:piggyBac transposable element-derived protein 4-like isoform X2 [Thunnus maccoyii]